MLTTLPKRSHDDAGGKLLIETYRRMLGHLPKGAISHLAEESVRRCHWFPTVAECLEITSEWSAPVSELGRVQMIAENRIRNEHKMRFEDAMAQLCACTMDQAGIDALPQQWRLIAAERGYLWKHPDGTFSRRGLPLGATDEEFIAEHARTTAMLAEWGWSEAEPQPVPRRVHIPADGPRSAAEMIARWDAEEATADVAAR